MKKPSPFRIVFGLSASVLAAVLVLVVVLYAVDYLLWDEQIQFSPTP